MAAYVGCIAGALSFEEYQRDLRQAGFIEVQIIDAGKDLNAYAEVADQTGCCSPPMSAAGRLEIAEACCGSDADIHQDLADLLRRYDVNEYAASVQVYAVKGR